VTCQLCKWYIPDPHSETFGYCSRFPPTVQLVGGHPITLRPRVAKGETCGEHQPKETV
jgi:hypothetical protein